MTIVVVLVPEPEKTVNVRNFDPTFLGLFVSVIPF